MFRTNLQLTVTAPQLFHVHPRETPSNHCCCCRITTPQLNYVGSVCVHFYYHMYGRDMGQLKLFRQSGSDYSANHIVDWSITGEQGDVWKKVSVNVNLSKREERVSDTMGQHQESIPHVECVIQVKYKIMLNFEGAPK